MEQSTHLQCVQDKPIRIIIFSAFGSNRNESFLIRISWFVMKNGSYNTTKRDKLTLWPVSFEKSKHGLFLNIIYEIIQGCGLPKTTGRGNLPALYLRAPKTARGNSLDRGTKSPCCSIAQYPKSPTFKTCCFTKK